MIKFILLLLSLTAVTSFTSDKILKRNNINKSLQSINMNSNSLLNNEGLPHFSKFSNDQIEPGISAVLNNLEQDFSNLEEKIKNEKNIDNLYNLAIEEIERIEYPLSFSWGLVSHLHSVKNNDELRDAYNKMQPDVIKLSNKISQSKILYDALNKLVGTSNLDKIKRRIVEASVRFMFLSGIGLEDNQKEEFNEIKLKLAELSTKFSNNVLDSIKEFEMFITDDEDMKQLPRSALELYSQQAKEKHPDSTPENGPWKVTLDIPSYLPIMQHHPSSKLREKLYKEYITRASEGEHNNVPVIEEILELKNKIANILDFKNYAELSLSKKMASTVQQIENLLIMIGDKARPYAEEDMKKVTSLASERLGTCVDKLELWDVPYWGERYKEQELEFKEEELKPYFPLDSVLSGLFKIASNLFGINVSEVDTVKENIDTWDESVKYFRITNDDDGELIATFFLDPYSRPGEKKRRSLDGQLYR